MIAVSFGGRSSPLGARVSTRSTVSGAEALMVVWALIVALLTAGVAPPQWAGQQ